MNHKWEKAIKLAAAHGFEKRYQDLEKQIKEVVLSTTSAERKKSGKERQQSQQQQRAKKARRMHE